MLWSPLPPLSKMRAKMKEEEEVYDQALKKRKKKKKLVRPAAEVDVCRWAAREAQFG